LIFPISRKTFSRGFSTSLLLLLLFFAPPALGQEHPKIAETAFSPESDPSGRWAEVIRETVRLRLATAGLPEEALEPVPPPEEGDVGEFLEEAEAREAAFALISDYQIDSNTIVMDLSLYDVEERELLASETRRGRLGLELDEVILAAVDSVLSYAALELGLSPEDFYQSPESVAAGATTRIEEEAPPSTGGEAADADEEDSTRYYLLSGISPFFASGATGTYFSTGLRPVISFLVGFPIAVGEIAVGLLLEGNRMAAEGSLGSGVTSLLSVAPEIRYQSLITNTISVFARLAGGASLLYFESDDGGNLQEVIPYGSTGIGAGFLITERFGIVAETGFAIYFEGDNPILGFAPAVEALWRF
jgi:hypothetical protein